MQESIKDGVWTFQPVEGFLAIEAQWDELNQHNQKTPLLDSMFIKPLLDTFASGKELIGIYKEQDHIKMIGIFIKRNPFQVTTFQPYQAPIGLIVFDLSIDPEALFLSLLKAYPGFILNLGILFQDSNFYRAIPNNAHIKSSLAFYTPSISIEGGFDEFWNQKSKSFKKQFNTRYNKLDKSHIKTKCLCITNPKQMDDAVAVFGTIESAGWKGRSQSAVHPDNIQGMLYRQIFLNFAQTNEVRIYQYFYDEKIVAVDMCLIRNKILYIMKTTYDEDQRETSPTQLMRREYLESFFKNKDVALVESYGHVKSWHQHVAQHIRPIFMSNIYRWNFLKKLHSLRIKDNLMTSKNHMSLQVNSYDSIMDLPAKLKNSLCEIEKTSFFHGYNWYELLENNALQKGCLVRIYIVEDSFNLVPLMIYPVLIRQDQNIFGTTTIVTDFSTVYGIKFSPIFLQENLEEEKLLSFFFATLKTTLKWDVLNINLLYDGPDTSESQFQKHMTACKENFLFFDKYHHSTNWLVHIENGDYQGYLTERPHKLQNTLRRKNKRLHEKASSEIVIYDNAQNIEKAIEDYQAIYLSSWKEAEISPALIHNFIRKTAELKILRLGILYIEGKPASFVKIILNGNKAIIYKLAYVPEYNSFSPGSLLLAEMIKYVVEKDNVEWIDYGIGDDNYKKDWMQVKTGIFGIIIFNSTTVKGLISALKHHLGKMLKKSKKNP